MWLRRFPVLFIFVRGLVIMSPAVLIGSLIARYVPPLVIGIGALLLLLFGFYVAGALLDWPLKKWK